MEQDHRIRQTRVGGPELATRKNSVHQEIVSQALAVEKPVDQIDNHSDCTLLQAHRLYAFAHSEPKAQRMN